MSSIRKLLLKRQGKTVVFVSHDMNAVREYCDRAIMIEKSEIIASGNAGKIATKYTRMFIEDSKMGQTEDTSSSNRWGTGDVKYSKPKITVTDKLIEIIVSAKANVDVKDANFGFSITDATGQKLLGTNSIIKKVKIPRIETNQRIKISWSFPNILRDGDYFVDLAAVNTSNTVWDWWEEAASFRILKEENTTYTIHPDININLEEVN